MVWCEYQRGYSIGLPDYADLFLTSVFNIA